MITVHVAFTPTEEAKQVPSDFQSIGGQRKNIFAKVILGEECNNAMLDGFEKIGWDNCGFSYSYYSTPCCANRGCVLALNSNNFGINGEVQRSYVRHLVVVKPK